jgi:uncharacterized protein (TIGR02611 family)
MQTGAESTNDSDAGAQQDGTPPHTGPASRAFSSVRAGIGRHSTANRVYRTSVGVAGAGTVVLGILLIPLPGPGSLIALGGLALLGTEFEGPKKASTTLNKAARAAVKRAKEHRAAKAEKAAKAASPASTADAAASGRSGGCAASAQESR